MSHDVPVALPPLVMGGAFINYRRHDERIAFVRTLYTRLAARFGDNAVFLDSATIGHGRRYPNQLRRHLDRSDVVVVVVHDGWARELETDGADWVHDEIRWALTAGKTIIPLLLDGAKMPRARELPRTIREFAHFQAHRAGDDPRHVRLCEKIADEPRRRASIGLTPARPWAGPLAGLLGVVAFAVPVAVLPASAQETAVQISIIATVVLVAEMISVGVVSLGRRQINSAERIAQDLDPTRYRLLVLGPGGNRDHRSDGGDRLQLAGRASAAAAVRPHRRPRGDVPGVPRDRAVQDPEVPRGPLAGAASGTGETRPRPPRARTPAAQARDRRPRTGPLARHASGERRRRARQGREPGRWSWLTADQTGQLLLGTVWAAAAVGLMTSAALPAMRLWVPAVALAVIVLIVRVTVEAAYRRQLWVRRTVADEVHTEIQRILDRTA